MRTPVPTPPPQRPTAPWNFEGFLDEPCCGTALPRGLVCKDDNQRAKLRWCPQCKAIFAWWTDVGWHVHECPVCKQDPAVYVLLKRALRYLQQLHEPVHYDGVFRRCVISSASLEFELQQMRLTLREVLNDDGLRQAFVRHLAARCRGKRLELARVQCGLTLTQAAQLLEMPVDWLEHTETHAFQLDDRWYVAFSRAYQVPVQHLHSGEDL